MSPVEAQATAGISFPSWRICLTIETSTVIPRSLKDPVWLLPHCLIQRSSSPQRLPSCSAQKRLLPPSQVETMLRSSTSGQTNSFFPQTPEP